MSSTSNEVCEMFNGQGIVRTMGRPTIAQLIILPDVYLQSGKDPSCGIYTIHEAVNLEDPNRGVMVYEGKNLVILTSVLLFGQVNFLRKYYYFYYY